MELQYCSAAPPWIRGEVVGQYSGAALGDLSLGSLVLSFVWFLGASLSFYRIQQVRRQPDALTCEQDQRSSHSHSGVLLVVCSRASSCLVVHCA